MKTLIVFSTKYGSVENAAKKLQSKLSGNVTLVNVMKEKTPDLDGYDNIILGGSVYVGKVQKELTAYINNNMPKLLCKRIGLFICAGQADEVQQQELNSAYPEELMKHAVVKDSFGYEYNLDKMKFLDKLMVGKIAGVKESRFELSDEKIGQFAKALL